MQKKPPLSYQATETLTTCASEDSIFSIFQNKVFSFTLSRAHWILSLPILYSAMSALFCLEKSFSCLSTPCHCSISSKFPLHIITACLSLLFFCLLNSSAYFLLVLMLPFTFPDALILVSFEGLTSSTPWQQLGFSGPFPDLFNSNSNATLMNIPLPNLQVSTEPASVTSAANTPSRAAEHPLSKWLSSY